jgi:hypothetical protein|uniref:Uncharacterized protein n=1 Tax=Myoviridae sp. ctqfO1 TaxID=2827710 RepID=A0A8S5T395_9CAUD|nr:MAG TPA: hypothetical protein [Myoviridae sp. ctqfO1]
MLTVRKEMNFDSLYELYDESWSGAMGTLDEIIKQGREEEAMQIIEETFSDEIPTDTQVNDFIWFELEDIMNLYDE